MMWRQQQLCAYKHAVLGVSNSSLRGEVHFVRLWSRRCCFMQSSKYLRVCLSAA
jgi:hypothetical protein